MAYTEGLIIKLIITDNLISDVVLE